MEDTLFGIVMILILIIVTALSNIFFKDISHIILSVLLIFVSMGVFIWERGKA